MKGWKRIIILSMSGIFGSVVLLYFILTSQFFIKSQILPRVSKAIGAPLTAEQISFSPFSKIEMHNLEIGSGESQLLNAKTIRCGYALMPFFRGELIINEFIIDGVKIQVVQDASGKSNLPKPPTKNSTPPSAAVKSDGAKTGLPFKPILKNIKVSDLSITVKQTGRDSQPSLLFELKNFNLNLPEFRLDKPIKLDLHGNLQLAKGKEIQMQNATLDGKLTAEINSRFQPHSVMMDIRINEVSGHFREIDLASHSIALNLNLTGNGNTLNLQQLSFSESNASQEEASILLSGSGTLNPLTADLNISVEPLTASALNLIGALAGGLDFGKTTINYQGRVKFQASQQLEAVGKLNVANASVTSPTLKLPIPLMGLSMSHAVSFDLKAQFIKVNNLEVNLSEGGRETLVLTLSRPLSIANNPASGTANVEPANINLSVKRFNLLLINAFLPPKGNLRLTDGALNADIKIDVANLGKQLNAGGRLTVENLCLNSGSNQIRNLNIKDEFDIGLSDFAKLKINREELEVFSKNQTALKVTLIGDLDIKQLTGDISVELPTLNEQLLDLIPLSEKTESMIQKMNLNGKIHVIIANQGKNTSLNGKLNMENLTVRSSLELPPKILQAYIDFDIDQTNGNEFKIRNLNLLAKNSKKTMAQLNAKGNLLMPPPKSESVLEVNSEFLDTQLLMSVFNSGVQDSNKKTADGKPLPKTDKPGPILPTKEPPAVDLKGLWLTIHLNMAQIQHGKIVISPLKSSIRIRDNKIDIQPLDMVLNQTQIQFRINADLNSPGYKYEVHGNMGAMNLDPIISATVPEQYRNCISGSIKGSNLDAKGTGITALNLSRNSDIHFKLDLGGLSLKNLPYQEIAANILLIPDINQIILDNGSVCLNSSGKSLSISGTQLSGPDFCFIGNGLIGFDETLNLKLTPGIGGVLGKKAAKLPTGLIFMERNGNYLMAPTLNYPITGTLRQPQIPNWEKLLTNAVKDTLQKQGEKVIIDTTKQIMEGGKIDSKELLRGLKSQPPVTAPEKPTSPSPQAPKQKKTQDDLIETGSDLLKGFLDKK